MKRRRVLAATVASAVILGVGAVTLPALAQEAGSISGHLTDNGAPVAGTAVTLYDTSFNFIDFTFTDSEGAFAFFEVPAGDYKIEFLADGLTQWAFQKPFFEEADVITVAEGATTVVEESLLPTGSITGTVANADGTPAAFLTVFAEQDGPPFTFGSTSTDENGRYTLSRLLPGEYRVSFRGGYTHYANDKLSFVDADLIPVVAGETTVLDQQLFPTGSIAGTVTNPDGTPASFVFVTADARGAGGSGGFAVTDENGQYVVSGLLPGTYVVRFQKDSLLQFAHGKTLADEADEFTVVAGATTTVDEQLLATGTLAGVVTNPDGSPARSSRCRPRVSASDSHRPMRTASTPSS